MKSIKPPRHPKPSIRGFTAEEQLKIDTWLETHQVKKLPSSAAMVMGSSSPGWQYGQERAVEIKEQHAKSRMSRQEISRRQRQRIAQRMDVPVLDSHVRSHKRQPARLYAVMVRYFDKEALICTHVTQEAADQTIAKFNKLYAETGARFFLAFGVPPTRYSWFETVKPMLLRQKARQRNKRSDSDGDTSSGIGGEQPVGRDRTDDQVQQRTGALVPG